ncbi:unnamed protein product [marine sediment metagenome]|uniref:Uncharacterized protein n=1 Tax=marine sediment metagenome TaxID=412755 RepID=X1R719_9ZZZZ
MISNKIRDEIAKLSAKPIKRRLRSTAYEQAVEKFCLPRCGKTPDGELCDEAEGMHRLFVALLFQSYSRLN